ncbi:rRNA maturation RNase YbeY [Bullifex porci]|uniref:Endoribonuclease YbeY n=1 Tax=Bullifex porci TaxID=2606638 RepID=A0A7X2PCL4_9SPIO|nr:rRNA maturation RNase YbeY [Bullifex porci]MDD7254924.1 rRNA maturation RNase YbeY [Bullifex porci]MDD7588213.1 rRNA maturation RNase YbeY [Bullifex porci]MDY2741609.1 rRNA maturation RNase YbeY [Bullifex porci]MSU05988.1 rRNA maturation RNase YbeY [Bullifex porci]
MFDIYYESEDFKLDAPEDVVTSILEYGEKKLNMNGNFSLSFVDSQEIQSLNRDYRAKDEVTDILTFSQEDGEEFPSFTDEKEYGDVFINLDRMKENAHEFSSSEREELLRLCLHGLLHLTGHDHATNDFEKEEMLILQEQLLASYLKL